MEYDAPGSSKPAKPQKSQPKAKKQNPKEPVKKQPKNKKEPKEPKRKRVTVKKYKPVVQKLLVLEGNLSEMIPRAIDHNNPAVWENVFNVKNLRYFNPTEY